MDPLIPLERLQHLDLPGKNRSKTRTTIPPVAPPMSVDKTAEPMTSASPSFDADNWADKKTGFEFDRTGLKCYLSQHFYN